MKLKQKLAIVTTHPIQYYAPFFRLMNDSNLDFEIKVFYTWSQSEQRIFDPHFKKAIENLGYKDIMLFSHCFFELEILG